MPIRINKEVKYKFLYDLCKLSNNGNLWLGESDLASRMDLPVDRVRYLLKVFIDGNVLGYEPELRGYMPMVKLVIDRAIYESFMSLSEFENKTYRQAKRHEAKRVRDLQKKYSP